MRALSDATPTQPILVRPDEAARLLRVGRTTVYALLAAGDLRSVQIGRSRRIPVREIERYVSDRMGEARDAT